MWTCPICQPVVQCSSDADRQRHEAGKKHIKRMEREQAKGSIIKLSDTSSTSSFESKATSADSSTAKDSVDNSKSERKVATPKSFVSNSRSSRPSEVNTSMHVDEHIKMMQLFEQLLSPSSMSLLEQKDETTARRKKLHDGESLSREKLLEEQEELRTCSRESERLQQQPNHTRAMIMPTMQTIRPSAPSGLTPSSKKNPGRQVLLHELRTNLDVPLYSCHILLRTISLPGRMASVMLVAEDSEQNVEKIAMYNCFDQSQRLRQLDQLLPVGTGLRIFNPWLKQTQDGWRTLCIDQPLDVEFLRSEQDLYEAGWPRPFSASTTNTDAPPVVSLEDELQALKNKGNVEIAAGDWAKCIETYSAAISRIPLSANLQTSASAPSLPCPLRSLNITLLGNRSEAYLRSGQFSLALFDANRVLALEPGQKKAVLRRLRALKYLERFDEMKADSIHASKEQDDELKDVDRLIKEKRGEWSLVALLQESHAIARESSDPENISMTEHDAACVQLGYHSTFVHPELIVGAPLQSTVSGRGVIVREPVGKGSKRKAVAIPAHTFVLSEKAIDIWHRRRSSEIELNLRSDSKAELIHRRSLKTALLKRCASNPGLTHALCLLDAGDAFQTSRNSLLSNYQDCIPSLSELLTNNATSDVTLGVEHAETLVRYHAFTFAEAAEPPCNSNDSCEPSREALALMNTVSCGLWFVASQFNHSCRPNCFITVVGDQMLIRTMRDISPGEELTISYLSIHPDHSQTYSERQTALGRMGIKCSCGWCEVFQVHPNLESIESDLIQKLKQVREELNFLLQSWQNAPVDNLKRKKLQRISDDCASLVSGFQDQVGRVCSDNCKDDHLQPKKGAAACLFVQLVQPLLMQSYIISQLHLGNSTASSSDLTSKKQRSKWTQQQVILCRQAANFLAHVVGPGSQLVTLISMEPLDIDSDDHDSKTYDEFRRRIEELTSAYELFHGVPLQRIGRGPSRKSPPAKAEFSAEIAPVVEVSAVSSPPSASLLANSSLSAQSSLADSAGAVQKALHLLMEPLRRFVLAQPTKESFETLRKESKKWDVPDCLKKLEAHSDAALAKLAKKALKLRNEVSHQAKTFDAKAARKGLELLKDLAQRVCADIETEQIEGMIVQISIPSDLQQLARNAINSAVQFEAAGQFTEGAGEITKMLQRQDIASLPEQDRAALFLTRAQANFKLERWKIARDDAEEATHLCPDDANASLLLVQALERLKLFPDAVGECERILHKHPHHDKLRLLQRSSSANVANQNHNWHSAQFEPELTADNIKLATARVKADLAARSPKPSEVLVIGAAEALQYSQLQKQKDQFIMTGQILRGEQKFKESFTAFKQAAELGSAEGLYNAGLCCSGGAGCDIDHRMALKYWQTAVKQKPWTRFEVPVQARAHLPPAFLDFLPNIGVRESENAIGNAFREGRGVDVNLKEAAEWYLRGADHGNPAAMNNLGHALLNGIQVTKDVNAAREWYKRAADSPEPVAEAMLNYADLCEHGIGGVQDIRDALNYCKKAAAMGMPNAFKRVQRLQASIRSPTSVSSTEALNPNLSETWYVKATNFHTGGGECRGDIDLEQAAQHYRKAMEMGHLLAPAALALLLENELRRPQEAFEVWLRADKDGNPLAYQHLAQCYAFGHGVERNELEAKKYHRRFQTTLNNPSAWHRFQRSPPSVSETLDVELSRKICSEEVAKGLPIDGFTIQQRLQRSMLALIPKVNGEASKEEVALKGVLDMLDAPPVRPETSAASTPPQVWLPLLKQRAEEGFETAQKVLNCYERLSNARERLNCTRFGRRSSIQLFEIELMPDMLVQATLHDLQMAFREYEQPVLDMQTRTIFDQVAEEGLKRDETSLDALLWTGRYFQGSPEERLEFWKNVARLHPNDSQVQRLLGCVYGFGSTPNWKMLEHHIRQAIDLEGSLAPASWQYELAVGMNRQWSPNEANLRNDLEANSTAFKCIAQYEHYLCHVSIDDPKVPEAHYALGMIYLLLKDDSRAEQQWFKGQATERERLPCLEAVSESFFPKKCLHTFRGLRVQSAGNPTSTCATCQYPGTSLRRCCDRIKYCDAQCQKRHRKQHQASCTNNAKRKQHDLA